MSATQEQARSETQLLGLLAMLLILKVMLAVKRPLSHSHLRRTELNPDVCMVVLQQMQQCAWLQLCRSSGRMQKS
jgi:hypothetical protein